MFCSFEKCLNIYLCISIVKSKVVSRTGLKCKHANMQTCKHAHAHAHTTPHNTCTCTCTCTCLHMCIHTCIHPSHAFAFAHAFTHAHAHTHTRTFTHKYTRYTYTHIHTNRSQPLPKKWQSNSMLNTSREHRNYYYYYYYCLLSEWGQVWFPCQGIRFQKSNKCLFTKTCR